MNKLLTRSSFLVDKRRELWKNSVDKEVMHLYTERIKLTAKEILEKDFKSGMRGYKPEDVDQFLDLIIKDYEAFHEMIDELQQENSRLKKQADQATQQRTKTTTTAQPAGTTNFDILKRLSNLEKHVFGSKLYE